MKLSKNSGNKSESPGSKGTPGKGSGKRKMSEMGTIEDDDNG